MCIVAFVCLLHWPLTPSRPMLSLQQYHAWIVPWCQLSPWQQHSWYWTCKQACWFLNPLCVEKKVCNWFWKKIWIYLYLPFFRKFDMMKVMEILPVANYQQNSRLLCTHNLVAVRLFIGYETWPLIGWHHPFVIGWSKYRLGSSQLQWIMWLKRISTIFRGTDSPLAQP